MIKRKKIENTILGRIENPIKFFFYVYENDETDSNKTNEYFHKNYKITNT